MQLTAIKLVNFRKYKDFTLSFTPGINVLKGPNEIGKTTLLDALTSVMFQDTIAKINSYQTWNSDTLPVLELDFIINEHHLKLKKDYNERELTLGYRDGDKSEKSQKIVRKLIADYTGFETDKAFLATACVRQHELARVIEEKMPFSFENVLLGGADAVDVLGIIKKLNSAVMDLRRGIGTKNPGLLIVLSAEIQKLDAPLKRITQLEEENEIIARELLSCQEELRPKKILLDRIKQYSAWKTKNNELEREFDNLQKITAELKTLQEEQKKAGNYPFTDREQAETIKSRLSSFKLNWLKKLIFILTLGIAYIIYRRNLKRLLLETGLRTIAEVEAAYDDYRNKYEENLRRKIMLENYNLEELQHKKRRLARELAVHQERQIEGVAVSAEQAVKLEEQTAVLEKKIAELAKKNSENEIRIKAITENIGERVDIEEKLEAIKNDLRRARDRYDILNLAQEKMEQARKDVLLSSIAEFEQSIAANLKQFTGGKYSRIKAEIKGTGIGLLIYGEEKNDWLLPEELSAGTGDQLYLAARITLLKLIAGEKRPPLIMDDPFTSFDRSRLRSAMETCREIAKDQQIILFTCTDQYDEYADTITELGT